MVLIPGAVRFFGRVASLISRRKHGPLLGHGAEEFGAGLGEERGVDDDALGEGRVLLEAQPAGEERWPTSQMTRFLATAWPQPTSCKLRRASAGVADEEAETWGQPEKEAGEAGEVFALIAPGRGRSGRRRRGGAAGVGSRSVRGRWTSPAITSFGSGEGFNAFLLTGLSSLVARPGASSLTCDSRPSPTFPCALPWSHGRARSGSVGGDRSGPGVVMDDQCILIAGGDGFLGQALVGRLLARGARIVVIDDHSTSIPRIPRTRCAVVEADVCTVDLESLQRPSAILHLASPAAPRCFAARPRVIAPNVCGTERLVELALRHGARLLFASSSEVYGLGSGDARPFHEVDLFIDQGHSGRACYAAAKRLGEEIVVAGRERGLDATCLRIFNVYGPGMDPTLPGEGRVVANFLHAIRTRAPLPIHGDGHQVRSFLWIDDFVDAILGLLALREPLPSAINVGRDEPVEILELARTLERALGRSLTHRLHTRPAEGTRWRSPDASKLRALTGWQPRVSLAEGLSRLLAEQLATDASDMEASACR